MRSIIKSRSFSSVSIAVCNLFYYKSQNVKWYCFCYLCEACKGKNANRFCKIQKFYFFRKFNRGITLGAKSAAFRLSWGSKGAQKAFYHKTAEMTKPQKSFSPKTKMKTVIFCAEMTKLKKDFVFYFCFVGGCGNAFLSKSAKMAKSVDSGGKSQKCSFFRRNRLIYDVFLFL